MAKLFLAQRLVLQAILDSPKDSASSVTDLHIAQSTRLALVDVREWLETLVGEGYVDTVKTQDGLSASITALGRQVLKMFQDIGVTASPTTPLPPPHGFLSAQSAKAPDDHPLLNTRTSAKRRLDSSVPTPAIATA